METHPEGSMRSGKSIRTWLFNPFEYVAGGKSLAAGVFLVLATGLIGSVSNSHFDGVLDFHSGAKAPLWMFVSEGLLDWLSMGILLLIGGKIISRSRIRPVDVFGTQALARSPALLTALFALLPGYQRFGAHLGARYMKTMPDVGTAPGDLIMFVAVLIVAVLMLVWMVALMYRAFAVSCNVRGGKAIGVFIAALILGEVLSKVLIMASAGLPAFASVFEAAEGQEAGTLIAPWTPGETTAYNWVTKQGAVIGETVYTIKGIEYPRGAAYEITAKTSIGEIKDDTSVIISVENLCPFTVRRVIDNAQGRSDISGAYEAGKLKIVADTPSGQVTADVDVEDKTYDNEEVLFLIRASPLRPNYVASFNFAVVATGAKGECTLRVLGEEKVKVPGGDFETYKVEFDFGLLGPKMYAWYGMGKPHYLVKYDNGNIICELKEAR